MVVVPKRRPPFYIFVSYKQHKDMFRLDDILEKWAVIYRPLSHDPSAKSKHRTYFRISMINEQSYFVRNYNTQPSPSMAYATHVDADMAVNPKFITYQHFVYMLVKQQNDPQKNTATDEIAATEARYECDELVQDLIAFLDHLKAAANNGCTEMSIAGHTFPITKDIRQGLRGLQLEKAHWGTLPTHYNGWQICGLTLDQLCPRDLCIVSSHYNVKED